MTDVQPDSPATIAHMQFANADALVVLVNEGADPGEGLSLLYAVDIGTLREAREIPEAFAEFEGWLTTFWVLDPDSMFIGTADGVVLITAGDDFEEFEISDRGVTSIVGSAKDDAYAATVGGEVFRWDGRTWNDLAAPFGGAVYALALGADGSLFACGADASFAIFDGTAWAVIEMPTNAQLNGLLVEPDGIVVSGNSGIVARLAAGELELLPTVGSNAFDLARFGTELCVAASDSGVLALKDEEWEPINEGFVAFGLASNDHFLVAAGADELAFFDRDAWTTVSFRRN